MIKRSHACTVGVRILFCKENSDGCNFICLLWKLGTLRLPAKLWRILGPLPSVWRPYLEVPNCDNLSKRYIIAMVGSDKRLWNSRCSMFVSWASIHSHPSCEAASIFQNILQIAVCQQCASTPFLSPAQSMSASS